MTAYKLGKIAQSLVHAGKGILAADESSPTIKKRFDRINVPSSEENRRSYREMLFTTQGLEEFVSGVILFDETLRQIAQDGTPFPKVLTNKGIIPGIKVDKGAKALAGFHSEKVTEGLDGLRDRLIEYRELGAQFAKWRAVITIGEGIPTRACIDANAHALARYAALCQEAELVPIVEPEVLMDGKHDIERCEDVTTLTLRRVFAELHEQNVILEAMLLKPNMVISGKTCPRQASVDEVAEATVRCMRRTVPASVPGLVFLSGGQSPEQATENLNRMNVIGQHPWELSFSYGRALQEPAIAAWQGKASNAALVQKALYHRAKCNGAARYGNYTKEME
ncbi:fructose-bisphosphate aldolase [Candidatus Thiomargarita nelsonii]|uniref:Probable fructose-bisphosphate aldolase class 1 n=1 Tax=Candidatus Thiomargarita nelsonii TaxID=1003181 RepID=A0A0A6S6V0_9GAMM|nr:fructose-bisphosphate aldolase [Candidatus Thiomargarita nelsonii]